MRMYFSGIGGAGIGPVALLAKDLGHTVTGSDLEMSEPLKRLEAAGIEVRIGQDGSNIAAAHKKQPIDWFVYTAALPEDHPELVFARENSIKHSKFGAFINQALADKQLKLIACSGTHGKTTSTSMMIWLFKQCKIPLTYVVGTELSWAPNGSHQENSEYFVLEADEYDRRFLDYQPYTTVVASVDYDHPDTYPTPDDYKNAFIDFIASSHCAYMWREDAMYLNIDGSMPHCAHIYGLEDTLTDAFKLIGEHNRHNAFLVAQAFKELFPDIPFKEIVDHLNSFPGAQRRFEKLSDNVYTDYAHHPAEIRSTIELAKEMSKKVVVVYQPHQNVRQKQLLDSGGYGSAFDEAHHVYWLPTYQTREDPALEIISPQRLADSADNKKNIQVVEDLDELTKLIDKARKDAVVIIMGAGDVDDWARQAFKQD